MRQIDILLAEDNPTDVLLTEEAIQEVQLNVNLHVVNDGEEALRWLKKEGIYAEKPTPDLILLDLNMPRMDGREFLRLVKSDQEFRKIPVVILTTSHAEEDVVQSYELHANCFITKPVDFEKFVQVVKSIEDFWLSIVRLPTFGDFSA